MKYFLDTEFIEGTQKTWFGGTTKSTIELISIGIVDENGKEYYAISKDFNLKEAWNRYQEKLNIFYNPYLEEGTYNPKYIKEYWIRENVLKPIWEELSWKYLEKSLTPDEHYKFTYSSLKELIKTYGKSNKQIAQEIKAFVFGVELIQTSYDHYVNVYRTPTKEIQFYGYYSDYDWVVFCWLFGKMNELPKEFPYYCIDLKQIQDDICLPIDKDVVNYICSSISSTKQLSWNELKYVFKYEEDITKHPNYPKQTNEHNAIADARWNKKLYEFLKSL